MRIEWLKIQFFRCFYEYEIKFAPKATVLFGRNGVGKTSLISALHKALSFVFFKDTKRRDDVTLTAGNSSLRVEGYDRKTDFMRDPKTGNAYPYINISAKGEIYSLPISWEMYASTSTFHLAKSGYKKTFTKFINQVNHFDELPVLAYYSDSFPHVETKSKIDRSITGLRNFGYYQWNLEGACSKMWIERLERTIKTLERNTRIKEKIEEEMAFNPDVQHEAYERVLAEISAARHEIDCVSECLKQFTEGDEFLEVQELTLDAYDDKLAALSSKGISYHFRKLPAGYKRLLYIVLDLSYRSFVLNNTVNSGGIVMIDEIDLHLHPGLEKEVLNRFITTFPRIQFIVSTHSPMVLTNLHTYGGECQIMRMEIGGDKPVVIEDIYGLDYNSGVEDIMGVTAKNIEIDNLLNTLAYLMVNHADIQAQNVRELLLRKLRGDEKLLEEMVAKRIKEMGNEIHR